MNDYFLPIIQRHRRAGVLVDTHLLLLYFVGSFRRGQITQFKRTNNFSVEDFDLLDHLIGQFTQVLTTPHILTEVSNLAGQLGAHLEPEFFAIFAEGITRLDERQLPSTEVAQQQEFIRFGLTDAALVSLARKSCLVLTAEFPLANYLQSLGVDVINFNHFRSWQ